MCAALFWGNLEQVLQCCLFGSIHCQIPGWAPRVPGGRGVGCITRGEGGGGDKRFLRASSRHKNREVQGQKGGKGWLPWTLALDVSDGSSSLEFSGSLRAQKEQVLGIVNESMHEQHTKSGQNYKL